MIGNPTPDFTYGLSLGVNYKNWSLGIDMMGQHGNEIFRTWTIITLHSSTICHSAWTAGTEKVPPTASRC